MVMRWKRVLKRIAVFVVVSLGLLLLLLWLADIPAQYPDHGLEALQETEDPAVVASVACLIEQVRLDPDAFGVGEDFEIRRRDRDSTVLIVHGWVRQSSVSWVENGIRVRTNPLSSGDLLPTVCRPWQPVEVETG